MLSKEDNEALTQVGPGTPMGALMRLYWLPFLPSADLVADGPPVRVRLLGEDLVAYRGSDGAISLVDHACPHRRAPMLFARNEECGLRCVYHGWKFDASGAVVDMPAEPARSRFKEKVRITAYPCRERNGVAWTYMGDAKKLLPLPNFEWNMVPAENVVVTLRVQECNWLQALEGEIDSAHAPILHGRVDDRGAINQWRSARDLRPLFDCVRQDFGVSIASRRASEGDQVYWRINQFVMPFYTLVPPQSKFPELSGHAWVPIDDAHTLCLMFSYHPARPMWEKSRQVFLDGHNGRESGHASRHAYEPKSPMEPYARYWTRYNRANAYRFHYAEHATWSSGLPGLWVQDAACQSGVEPVCDRTREHLGMSDSGIAATRRCLLGHLRALRESGEPPPRIADPDLYMVRAASLRLAKDVSWVEAGAQHIRARLGEDFGYEP